MNLTRHLWRAKLKATARHALRNWKVWSFKLEISIPNTGFMSIQVAARSKVWVYTDSLAGIAGSNPPGGMDSCHMYMCVVSQRSLRRADHSSRGVLSSVACDGGTSQSGLGPIGLSRLGGKNWTHKPLTYCDQQARRYRRSASTSTYFDTSLTPRVSPQMFLGKDRINCPLSCEWRVDSRARRKRPGTFSINRVFNIRKTTSLRKPRYKTKDGKIETN